MYLDIMDCLMDIFVISLFLVVFLLLFFRTRKKLKRVCVVVLGDIGRSPRMQYHALSFVNEGYFVEIVAYSGSLPLRKLQDNPNVKLYYLSNPPNLNRLIQVISYVVRTIWQSINLFYVLFLKSNASYLILQNPPAIPSIPICWLYCCIMKVELAIDWHNYTYTILALNAKQKNFIVNLVLFIESFFGNKAKYNFCVTKAMKEDLFNKWKIQAKVLYDRPADQFRPIPIKEKHELLLKLSKIYNIFKGTKENSTAFTELTENGDIVLCNERPGLIISSTSWTDDEDFSILLNALNNYNYECKRNELANFPNLICVITGKGPLKEFYKNIIQMQNWKHVTVITPWLDHEDYPKLIDLHTNNMAGKKRGLYKYYFEQQCSKLPRSTRYRKKQEIKDSSNDSSSSIDAQDYRALGSNFSDDRNHNSQRKNKYDYLDAILNDYLESDEEMIRENFVEGTTVYGKHFSKLSAFLKHTNCNSISDAELTVSKSEILLGILKYSMHHSLTNDGTEDLCKLINNFFNKKIIPDTRYCINKLFSSNSGVDFHAFCEQCSFYINKFERATRSIICPKCDKVINLKGANTNFVVVVNIHNTIQNAIEKNGDYYDYIINHREQEDGIVQDIFDGTLYRNFVNSLDPNVRRFYATCVFNSDASPVFKSSTYSITTIQIILNELPVNSRNNKPITCGLWFSKTKPNMNIFLKVFADNMNKLSNDGIFCKINDYIRNVKLFPLCCCVDSVARAPMQGLMQFNGRCGCSWCVHPGKSIKQKTKKTIKYPLLNFVPDKRTKNESLPLIEEAITLCEPVFGFKFKSSLLELRNFDIVKGFVPDSMHCISLGVCRQFPKYWFKNSHKAFCINSDYIKQMDDSLKLFKIPRQIERLTRSLNDRKYWKAKEWENWLLFYSIPLLNEIPHFQVYLQHWALLVDAMHILMGSSITTMQLTMANNKLKKFVCLTEKLYSSKAMTYNVHQILHLTQSVVHWGPLWAHSGFTFENGNGKIVKNIKAARGVLHQLCRKIDFEQSAEILEKHIREQKESRMLDFCNYLEYKQTMKTEKLLKSRYFGRAIAASKTWIQQLQLSNDSALSYSRMLKDNCIFSSTKNRSIRSSNCFSQLSDGSYIEIIEFIVDSANVKEFTICKQIITENLGYCDSVKKIINISHEVHAIHTNTIKSIAVYMKVKENSYICCVPNMYCF